MSILYNMLLITQIAFFTAAYFLAELPEHPNESFHLFLKFLIPSLVLASIFGSGIYFKKQLIKHKQCKSLKDKLTGYITALVLKYAMLEVPAIMAIVAYFVSADILFLGLAGILIIIFLLHKPSQSKTIAELSLSPEERQKVLDPAALVSEVKVR
ncbi:hypothetical protein KZP23_06415 [Echinicola marina]|uniref:hypothetical protein n=1 Tax=Echinicola marina TaxID=2859768 RepID=UPI001CF67897|nr:hypothetical protein [Echinicola marina]UCS94643.1 hypothetical protein KZP23_06415 [Echinicola marina]